MAAAAQLPFPGCRPITEEELKAAREFTLRKNMTNNWFPKDPEIRKEKIGVKPPHVIQTTSSPNGPEKRSWVITVYDAEGCLVATLDLSTILWEHEYLYHQQCHVMSLSGSMPTFLGLPNAFSYHRLFVFTFNSATKTLAPLLISEPVHGERWTSWNMGLSNRQGAPVKEITFGASGHATIGHEEIYKAEKALRRVWDGNVVTTMEEFNARPKPRVLSKADIDVLVVKAHTAVQQALSQGRCSFTATGKQFATQPYYGCKSCGKGYGVCLTCKVSCHPKDHEYDELKLGNFYCDCGSSGGCKFLEASAVPLVPSSLLLWRPATSQPVAAAATVVTPSPSGPINPTSYPKATCPSAHPLIAVVGRDPVRCDMCGTDSVFHSLSCVECDYETCEPCLRKAFLPTGSAPSAMVPVATAPVCLSGHTLTRMPHASARCDECGAMNKESLCCNECNYNRCSPACQWTKPEIKVGKDGRNWFPATSLSKSRMIQVGCFGHGSFNVQSIPKSSSERSFLITFDDISKLDPVTKQHVEVMRIELDPFIRPNEYVYIDAVLAQEIDSDHSILSVPLFTGTPSVFITHRLLLLLLDYPNKSLKPIYTTGNFAPEVCTSFNLQMSYRPGNPARSFILQPTPYGAFNSFKLQWDGAAWSIPQEKPA